MFNFSDLIVPDDKEIKQIASIRRPSFDRANSIIVGNKVEVAVCFIGDSITESFEVNAYFHDLGIVINRGIGFDTLKHTNCRLEADLLQLKPKVGVFMCGINDIGPLWRKYIDGKEIKQEDYDETVSEMNLQFDEIFEKCARAKQNMIFCSIMPVGVDDVQNPCVKRVNEHIKDLCKKYSYPYADYYSALVDDNGLLKDVTFGDLLHPHVDGYNIMAEVLKPILIKSLGER